MALECAICFEPLVNPEQDEIEEDDEYDSDNRPNKTPVLTKCGHMYHQDCLQQCLRAPNNARARKCPLCREKVAEREVTVMHFRRQIAVTERAKKTQGPKEEKQPASNCQNSVPKQKRNEHVKCFNNEAHQKLIQDFEVLRQDFNEKKDRLALIQEEKAKLQSLVDHSAERLRLQKPAQGTKRKVDAMSEE